MPDAGTIAADKAQKELESRIRTIYSKARKDVSAKLKAHTAAFKAKDKQKRAQVKAGLISKQDYSDWKQGQVFTGKMWQDKLNSIEYTLLHAAEQVNDIVEGQKLAIFGENATYMAYRFSKDTGLMSAFNVYDAATVTRLVKEQPELLPRKEINGVKQDAWERKKISNRVASGIVSGESIEEIAKGIADETALTDEKAAVRYARTAMTSAQNAGRVAAMKDAQAIGINVEKLWIATLDAHTRDAHAHLDGQTAKVNEPFISKLGEIDYPGDPFASPANVYNCRCTLGYHYPEYSDYSKMERIARYEEGDPQYEPGHRNYETVQGMTYEKWVEHKQEQIRQRYGGEQTLGPEMAQNTGIEELRSIAERSTDKYDFWTNLDENQQAVFMASGMSLDDAYNTLHGNAAVKEWKDPAPGGAQSFAIEHDFSNANVDFVKVKARSEGWMADANTAGVINIRENGLGEGWEFIIGHESGHQLADFSDKIQQMIIMNPGDVFGRYNLRLMAFEGVYGEYNPEEAFATCVSNFINHPDAMKDKYPKSYEAIDTLFKTSPSALDFVRRTMDKYRKEFL